MSHVLSCQLKLQAFLFLKLMGVISIKIIAVGRGLCIKALISSVETEPYIQI